MSKYSQEEPTRLLTTEERSKIKQSCFNTHLTSAAQNESVHLDFCWLFQMVSSGMLEKVIFYLSLHSFQSHMERSQELLELTQSLLSGSLMSVIAILTF